MPDVKKCRCKRHAKSDPWHGTTNGYHNHRCRCALCKEAHNIEMATWVEANKGRPIPEGVDPDSLHAYKYYGSRTTGARAANAERRARQREAQKR
jgi:hypothetical protein